MRAKAALVLSTSAAFQKTLFEKRWTTFVKLVHRAISAARRITSFSSSLL
jgi:hypothetical protein